MSNMAAAESIVLRSSLCFLVNKFGKIAVKPLTSMLLDFYEAGELVEAKRQLLSDVNDMNLDIEVPHIPERRDGESKVVRTVHDIFTILTFLDENMKINLLPRYVAESPDAMPSARLYDGDLAILMKVLDRLENEVKSLSKAMAAMMKEVGQSSRSNIQPVPPVLHSVINNDLVTGDGGRAQRGSVGDVNTVMTSGDSLRQAGNPHPVQSEHTSQRTSQNWADIAASTPITVHNRYVALATDGDDDDDDQRRGSFIEQRSRRSAKRRRNHTSEEQRLHLQQLHLQPSGVSATATTTQGTQQRQQNQGVRRRGRVMLTGKSTSIDPRFAAAKKITKKAVFCVDNIDLSLDTDDLRRFVNSLNVQVISCFPVHPRRRRNEIGPVTDRKAFRLCINDSDQDRLLDDSKWPESVIISNWYYLKPSETRQRSNVNTGRENVALAAAAVVTGSSAAASTEGPLDSDAIGDDAELRETMNTDAEEEATEISESTVIIIDGAASVQA